MHARMLVPRAMPVFVSCAGDNAVMNPTGGWIYKGERISIKGIEQKYCEERLMLAIVCTFRSEDRYMRIEDVCPDMSLLGKSWSSFEQESHFGDNPSSRKRAAKNAETARKELIEMLLTHCTELRLAASA